MKNIMKEDEYLKELMNIHLNNCGICVTTRTITFDKAIDYLKEKYQIYVFADCENYLNSLIDEIILNTKYDINITIPKEIFEKMSRTK